MVQPITCPRCGTKTWAPDGHAYCNCGGGVEVLAHRIGDRLAKRLTWFGNRKCGNCEDLRRILNIKSTEWIAGNREKVIRWLRRAAAQKKVSVDVSDLEAALDAAINPVRAPRDGRWFIAVTTAPRKECTLAKCVQSIRECGWEPMVFAEPGSTSTDCETVWNKERLGIWHNWIHSARWCLEHTSSELILTVQDDALFHPESRVFAESILWPSDDAGFISLYTPKHYTIRKDKTIRDPGVNRIFTRSLWGACALIWDRRVLREVVGHTIAATWSGAMPRSRSPSVIQKRLDNPHTIANSDTAIGKIMNRMKRTMWFVDPSPVQHIARYSTIAHGDNSGRRNAHRIADHQVPLAEQVPGPSVLYRLPDLEKPIATIQDNVSVQKYRASRIQHGTGLGLCLP